MRALFLLQNFESRRFEESPAWMELARPLLASGFITAHEILTFGRDMAYYEARVEDRVRCLGQKIGTTPLVVYGAGAHTARYLKTFRQLNIVALADKDPKLQGHQRFGLPVIAPNEIADYAEQVLISSKAWEGSIIEDLQSAYGDRITCHGLYQEDKEMDSYLQTVGDAVDQALDSFSADLLVYSPAHPSERLPAEKFFALRQRFPGLKILTIWWDHDEAADGDSFMAAERESLTFADYIIENSAGSRIARMRRRQAPYQHHCGAEKVHFNPTPFDPDVFFATDQEKHYDISIMGSPVGNRRELIEHLHQDFGGQFHHWGGVYLDRPPLPMVEYADKIRQSRILINSQTFSFAPQCKGKVRETLSCGGFLLEEDNPETRLFVAEGKGVIYYQHYDDLKSKIRYYLDHECERQAIAEAGYHWFRHHHNCEVWAGRIFDALWPEKDWNAA